MTKTTIGAIIAVIIAAVAAMAIKFLIEDKNNENNSKAVKFHQRNYATIK